jgi:hypothetical protein
MANSHRNLDNWTELRVSAKRLYRKRTLDFHSSELFKTRQGKDKEATDWLHKIQTLGSQFHEAALLDCSEGAQEGIMD